MLGPDQCISASNQTYCSKFTSDSNEACRAREGSPVICGEGRGNPEIVAGMLISRNYCHGSTLYFNSLDNEVGDWINRVVSGAETASKYSFALIISAIFISLKKLL
jgi:hypothetical protein